MFRAAALLTIVVALWSTAVRADIFQWEYIDPANPALGKRQSTTLCPDGAGVGAEPFAAFASRDLTMAYLMDADLRYANAQYAQLIDAELSYVNFDGADLRAANLLRANLTGANVRGAHLGWMTTPGTFTAEQLYSTASYQARDLTGVRFWANDMTGWNFAHQNLTAAEFNGATLESAAFSGANVMHANLGATKGFTADQLYSTTSYQARDLAGIGLGDQDLSGWDFAEQNLSEASFYGATLTNANLSNANLAGAVIQGATLTNANLAGANVRHASFSRFLFTTSPGLTATQLYSTASYEARDLTGIDLSLTDLTGWNFARQNLTGARFGGSYGGATLTDADLSQSNLANAVVEISNLTNANLSHANLEGATFYGSVMTGANLIDAVVRRANFNSSGLTADQLYTTASYQSRDLSGIDLGWIALTGANLAGQNLVGASFGSARLRDADLSDAILTSAYFHSATLTNADFTRAVLHNAVFGGNSLTGVRSDAADLRGAEGSLPGGINTILRDGRIDGLTLIDGKSLVIRNYSGDPDRSIDPIPILVQQHLTMDATGRLTLTFEDSMWHSLISFDPGIPAQLGGTLELTFANDVDVSAQIGRTIHIFDWTSVEPTGTFAVSSLYPWDVSALYTTGEVTLLLPGDTNGDLAVTLDDLNNVRNNFGLSGTGIAGDTNGDHTVDLIDLNNVRNFFGMTAPQAVPEPTSFLLSTLATIAALVGVGARQADFTGAAGRGEEAESATDSRRAQ